MADGGEGTTTGRPAATADDRRGRGSMAVLSGGAVWAGFCAHYLLSSRMGSLEERMEQHLGHPGGPSMLRLRVDALGSPRTRSGCPRTSARPWTTWRPGWRAVSGHSDEARAVSTHGHTHTHTHARTGGGGHSNPRRPRGASGGTTHTHHAAPGKVQPQDPGRGPRAQHAVAPLKDYVLARNLPLLLHGPAGTGKTSSVRYAVQQIYEEHSHVLELNASDDRGVDCVRHKIKEYAGSPACLRRASRSSSWTRRTR